VFDSIFDFAGYPGEPCKTGRVPLVKTCLALCFDFHGHPVGQAHAVGNGLGKRLPLYFSYSSRWRDNSTRHNRHTSGGDPTEV